MAASGLAMSLPVLVLLLQVNLGAAVSTILQEPKSLVRKEVKEREELSPKAEVSHKHKHGHHHGHHHRHHRAKTSNFCGDDYPFGDIATGDEAEGFCLTAKNHSQIRDQDMCIEAADEMGGQTVLAPNGGANTFLVPENPLEQVTHHVRGCFTVVDDGVVYYRYNPSEKPYAQPVSGLTGQPVCVRSKYQLSLSRHSHDGCHDDYKPIVNEHNCMLAANCLSDPVGAAFKVLDTVKQQNWTKGCFLDRNGDLHGDGDAMKIYYNPVDDANKAAEATVKGQPLCVIKTRKIWQAGVAADAEAYHATAAAGAEKDRHDVLAPDAADTAAAAAAPAAP